MQIVTSIEQFGNLKNMLVEKVFIHLKVHEETLFGYEDRGGETPLTHICGVARTDEKE